MQEPTVLAVGACGVGTLITSRFFHPEILPKQSKKDVVKYNKHIATNFHCKYCFLFIRIALTKS